MSTEEKVVLKKESDIKDVKFPGNSKTKKKEEPKEIKQITKGKVTTKKKGLGKRVADTLVDDDAGNVWSYLMYDVLVPAAKNTISEMVSGGVEMLLFGDTRGSRTRRDRGRSYVSYNSPQYGRTQYGNVRQQQTRDISYRNRARHNFDDIILDSRGEAEQVLSHMVDLVDQYGMCTVADMYDLVGVTSNFTDRKYGWTSLGSSLVVRVREGYLLELPKTELLD